MLEIQQKIDALQKKLKSKLNQRSPIDPTELDDLRELRKERDKILAAMPEAERIAATAAAATNGDGHENGKSHDANIPPNVVAVLQYLETNSAYKDALYFDEFYNRIFIERGGKIDPWTDADDIALLVELQHIRKFERLRGEIPNKAVIHHAMQNRRNAPRDWIAGLKWDGRPRIASFFSKYMGAKAAPGYVHAVSHNFWVSLIARVFKPGCTNYHMVILEGSQGIGKSTALRLIGGSWYSEALESVQSKDFFVTLQGKILIEIGELDSFSRAEVTRIKQVISSTVDNFRSPYGRHSMDHPRTCIFVGTTNDDAYLRDATGALRFWPMPCGKINTDQIAKDRDQLFAESLFCYEAGETWHETPKVDALDMQEARREGDALEDVLREKLNFDTPVMINEVCAMLGVTAERMDRRFQLRVANALRQLGYTKKQARYGEKREWKWVKKE
jgi:predicted P-loop ATPase